ncbi:pyridoxal phosphate-dependent aminotransferase [Methanococcus voltae]|uniref:pyridoxal phosphate-dependent aminotransferase n=1 Tax=Methanococcus voltae TaxID=2188 RepID=UPI001AEB089A|nr:pyridoxal phosphate-dependent aminotransferase [Methanococcus voltae]MBP2172032.1 aspartate/methionine/tyrosine aminotransferase [Methanococcus voltae]
MRNNIVNKGTEELSYEIRGIVAVAERAQKLGKKIIWENIGDPIAKGEQMPEWIKEIVSESTLENKTYGYCPTQGLLETREFLADLNNSKNGAQITSDDMIFFNGLGDAITNIYGLMRKECRVIGPTPAYSTHSSAEGLYSNSSPVMYSLDKDNLWYPDLDDLENKVKYNPSVSGILLINPGNPTGAVYSKKVLSDIVDIANEYDVFILCDEIYQNLVYNGKKHVSLSEVIDDVCGISMKGISKDLPWPGSRCGWTEFYNKDKDPVFKKYVENIGKFKMIEVCSTTLPQTIIPKVMGDKRFEKSLGERKKYYEKASNYAYKTINKVEGVSVNLTNGAFYGALTFDDGVLNDKQHLKMDNELDAYINGVLDQCGQHSLVEKDKRFVYQLLGASGICMVPLTSFCSKHEGLRFTLLEKDENLMKWTFKTLSEKIDEYLNSSAN